MIEPEHAPRLNGGARVLGTGVRHHPTMESRRPRESVVRDRLSLGATARRTPRFNGSGLAVLAPPAERERWAIWSRWRRI
jgi:hypothetical protein